MKLLIAEDSLTQRVMLKAITSKWGFDPILAEDGQAAWDILSAEDPPRLLLLDWEMPTMSGLELCQRLRTLPSDDPPFILLLTGRTTTEDIVTGLESGANDYIAKPYNHAELKARLDVGRRMLGLQHELNSAKQTLAFQASHDTVTGLLNRGAVMNQFEREMDRAKLQSQPLLICMIDIDHFKQVNDTHGHLAGDTVLRMVASRLATTLRPFDVVGRYGGEEFLVLLNCNREHGPTLLERVRRAIADEHFVHEQASLQITISCGATFFIPTQDARKETELLNAADAALYKAKHNGRNCIEIDTLGIQ